MHFYFLTAITKIMTGTLNSCELQLLHRHTEVTEAEVLSSAGPSLFTVLKGPAPSDILST